MQNTFNKEFEKDLKENWQFLKSEVLKRWNRLAEADVENAHGNLQALNKIVQKEYGVGEQNFDENIQRIYDDLKSKKAVKKAPTILAGSRDHSPERKLNENYSHINSPEEVAMGKTEMPYIKDKDAPVEVEEDETLNRVQNPEPKEPNFKH